MVDDVTINKVAIIERCVKRVREEYAEDDNNLFRDFTRQDSIILNIQRACEAAIDLAMHLVRTYRLGVPQESRDAFELLRGAGRLDAKTTEQMKRMVGFRRATFHGRPTLCRTALSKARNNQGDPRVFAAEVAKRVGTNVPDPDPFDPPHPHPLPSGRGCKKGPGTRGRENDQPSRIFLPEVLLVVFLGYPPAFQNPLTFILSHPGLSIFGRTVFPPFGKRGACRPFGPGSFPDSPIRERRVACLTQHVLDTLLPELTAFPSVGIAMWGSGRCAFEWLRKDL